MSVLECQWYEEEYQNMCRTKPSFFIRIVFSVAIIAFILGNFSYFVFTPNDLNVLDADRTDRDTTFLAVTPSGEVITHPFQTVDWNPEYNKIVEVVIQGHVVWECQGLAFPHELLQLPNGHILVANTGADNIVEIDYPNTNIVWTWNVADMDWSLVNPAWDADHYYNTPQEHDWSHINHVAFKQYDTWNACLISIRNFDMILELNYTEARFGDTYNPANIIWYYGDYGNYTMLRHQHNPDYTPNGNIIVADSHNSRIIEIDYATKEIVWDFSDQLQWCRDADIMQNGNVLITDSDEVMEVNYATKRIVWRYFTDMVVPYEAEIGRASCRERV